MGRALAAIAEGEAGTLADVLVAKIKGGEAPSYDGEAVSRKHR